MSKFLFTVIPTNDFGVLTRSLPIARELKKRGHEVAFCHPASGPQIVIAEEGFENLEKKNLQLMQVLTYFHLVARKTE